MKKRMNRLLMERTKRLKFSNNMMVRGNDIRSENVEVERNIKENKKCPETRWITCDGTFE